MYFLLFLCVLCVIYINTFKDDFTKEKIDKVAPIITLTVVIVMALCILTSVMTN